MYDAIYNKMISEMKKLNVFEVVVSEGESTHDYVLKKTGKVNVHSISKLVTGLCIGAAIDSNYFREGIEEPILKYFPEITIKNKNNYEFLQHAKLKHLLTLTLGHDGMLLSSQQINKLKGYDLAEFVLNYPIVHAPGSHFVYSSAPVYLASIMINKATGKSLLEFSKSNIFSKLGIFDVDWTESEQGYNLGCTGLKISGNDLHKVGVLLLNDGLYNGERIISKTWVSSMKAIHAYSPNYYNEKRVLPKYGYGYNLWICKNGIYFCDGTAGQYVIVVPDKKMVITTVGEQEEMSLVTESLREIIYK